MLKGGAGSDEWEDMGLLGRVTHATRCPVSEKCVTFRLVRVCVSLQAYCALLESELVVFLQNWVMMEGFRVP